MRMRFAVALVPILLFHSPTTAQAGADEYAKHFDALSKLSVAMAEAMPADQYGFKPHPASMNFGELMATRQLADVPSLEPVIQVDTEADSVTISRAEMSELGARCWLDGARGR